MPDKIGDVEVYSTEEVSIIIGRSYQTVRNLIHTNKITAKKIGQTFLVERSDLEDYLYSINLPADTIEYRMGIRSPKTGAIINKKNPVA